MATPNSTKRQTQVGLSVAKIKNIIGERALTQPILDDVLQELLNLARQTELWSADEFPDPQPDELQARYMIHEDANQTYGLYLNVMRPGKKIVPHNHTTWACIAAVEGVEKNFVYERLDDGTVPGVGQLKQTDVIDIGPGTGIALMPDDIHAVQIQGDIPIRHLHMYGNSLETLTERMAFDLDTGRCERMAIGVKTRR